MSWLQAFLPTAVHYNLIYYCTSFLFEPLLLSIIVKHGLPKTLLTSRLLSLEYVVLYYPVIYYSMGPYMSSVQTSLFDLCYSQTPRTRNKCPNYLSYTTSPFSMYLTDPNPYYSKRNHVDEHKWEVVEAKYVTDAGDQQWKSFRSSLLLLSAFAFSSTLLSSILLNSNLTARLPRALTQMKPTLTTKSALNLIFGMSFVLYIHGLGALFPLLFALSIYLLSNLLAGSKLHNPAVWAMAMFTIYAKEPNFGLRGKIMYGNILGEGYRWMDQGVWKGEYDWHLSMNLVLLRLISFSMDYHYATLEKKNSNSTQDKSAAAKPTPEPTSSSSSSSFYAPKPPSYYKSLCATSHKLEIYSFPNLLSHAFYAPLFLAGPTITFNSYMHHCLPPSSSSQTTTPTVELPDLRHKLVYTAVTVIGVCYLDVLLSLVHPFALLRSGWSSKLSISESCGVTWFMLAGMWLKFATLWRFARCWGMWDGVEPPENMNRTWNNNWSIAGFWKGWHSSFNLWLVRYIYVPLGGRGNKNIAVWFVFAFVAIWHDAEMKLAMWGGLNAAFFVVENVGRRGWEIIKVKGGLGEEEGGIKGFAKRTFEGLAGAVFILVLMGVNSIGYGGGISGTRDTINAILGDGGKDNIKFVFGCIITLHCGVMVMFEIRRIEKRLGRTEGGGAEQNKARKLT